jgi:hypothetical protein
MKFRERPRRDETCQDVQPPPAGSAQGADLSKIRQTAEAFIAAGDQAIDRALSGNSEQFLAACRQQGGE